MKSKQFPSMEAAKAYMEERGKLIYWGREGTDAKTYVYTLTIGGKVHHVLLEEDGYLRVIYERFKRNDE
jgi:hypothetical protein